MTSPYFFNKKLALFLLELCQFTGKSYGLHGIIKHNGLIDPFPKGFKHVKSFRVKPFRKKYEEWIGYLIESSDSIVIAFRSPKFKLSEYVEMSSKQSSFTRLDDNGMIHDGILATYESCRKDIIELYQRLPSNKTLYITGYRYGGALATLHAVDVAENFSFEKVVMYNFAAPAVGDETFAKIYNLNVPLSFRILYEDDPYPKAPLLSSASTPPVPTYTHVALPIMIKKLKKQEKNYYSFENYRKGIETNF